ncbi:MAG: DUF3093 domain-containing protein [Candidatus Nanopelagicales bacterium]
MSNTREDPAEGRTAHHQGSPGHRPAAAPPSYAERLWPGPWLWLLCLGAAGSLAVAYTAALGPAAGWLVGLAGTMTVVAAIASSTPRVTVTPGLLHAGRAVLPLHFAGRVLPLDAASARLARGPAGDPTAYVLLRPGVGPGAVVVEVTDAEDPHRTWLLASRHPERLASAIRAARGTLLP